MGLITKMLHSSIDFGGKVADAVVDMVSKTGSDLGESAAQTALEMKIKMVNSEIEECYRDIGRRVVNHIRTTRSSPNLTVYGEPLRNAIAKTVYKEQLEAELAARERQDEVMNSAFGDRKRQLDQALAAGLITQQEYDTKLLNVARTGSF